MRIPVAAVSASLVVLALTVSQGVAAAPQGPTDIVQIPTALVIRPSAKALIQACVGEAVSFQGTSLMVAHQTVRPDGSLLLDMLHFNGQGSVAIGASTGTTYRIVGADTNTIVFAPQTLVASYEANLRAISPGAANDFIAHILEHIVITPDGSLVALIEVADISCQ